MIGSTQSSINRYENGQPTPTVELLRRYADYFDVSMDYKINRIIDALLAMQEREDVTLPALRRQLAEAEKGIENMPNAIQQGIFTASTKQRLEELEKQKEELSLSTATAELQKLKLTQKYMEY